jgi:hypothetical protein
MPLPDEDGPRGYNVQCKTLTDANWHRFSKLSWIAYGMNSNSGRAAAWRNCSPVQSHLVRPVCQITPTTAAWRTTAAELLAANHL